MYDAVGNDGVLNDHLRVNYNGPVHVDSLYIVNTNPFDIVLIDFAIQGYKHFQLNYLSCCTFLALLCTLKLTNICLLDTNNDIKGESIFQLD